MRAYLIDPEQRSISEVSYNGDFRKITEMLGEGVSAFDCARFNDEGDAVFVDDEGLLKEPEWLFRITGYPSPLAGRGLVLGCDMSTGESTAPSVDMEWLRDNVFLLRRIYHADSNTDQR